MKLFGKLKTFDQATGLGSIRSQVGTDIAFDRSSFSWGACDAPRLDTRVSYSVGKDLAGNRVAIDLLTV